MRWEPAAMSTSPVTSTARDGFTSGGTTAPAAQCLSVIAVAIALSTLSVLIPEKAGQADRTSRWAGTSRQLAGPAVAGHELLVHPRGNGHDADMTARQDGR